MSKLIAVLICISFNTYAFFPLMAISVLTASKNNSSNALKNTSLMFLNCGEAEFGFSHRTKCIKIKPRIINLSYVTELEDYDNFVIIRRVHLSDLCIPKMSISKLVKK